MSETQNLLQIFTSPVVRSRVDSQRPIALPHKSTPCKSLRYLRQKQYRATPLAFTSENIISDSTEEDAAGWTSYVHPEELRYYHNVPMRITTDANMRKDLIFHLVTEVITHLLAWLDVLNFKVHDHQEVVIELNEEQDGCNYYMVDHRCYTVFYPDETNTENLEIRDVVSTQQLKVELERQYWLYVEYFPMHKDLGASLKSYLLGILLHSTFDSISSSNSTSVIGTDESLKYIKIIRNFTGTQEAKGYEQCIMARIMEDLVRGRVVHYYGEAEGARLARREYIDDGSVPDSRAFWFAPVSLLFVGQPNKKLKMLESLSVNFIFYKDTWTQFNKSHVSEWKRVSSMSLGLMIADIMVSLSYFQGPQGTNGTVRAIASQIGWHSGAIATLSCFASIIIALTAINVHQPCSLTDAGDAAVYFQNAYNDKHGFQLLAIVLGLPSTMFLWALCGTAVSLIALSFCTEQTWSMVILGVIVLMVCLVLWAIRTLRTGEEMILPSLFGSTVTPVGQPTRGNSMDIV